MFTLTRSVLYFVSQRAKFSAVVRDSCITNRLQFRTTVCNYVYLHCNYSTMAPDKSEKFERLPQVAKPSHYHIHLKPHLDKFTFEGDETIELEVGYT